MRSKVNRRRFEVLGFMLVLAACGSCTVEDTEPETGISEPASIDDFEDLASEERNELAGVATIVDPTTVRVADLSDLTVGDQVRFQLPAPGVRVRQVFEIACKCAWSVEPETAGVFDPPGGCTTVYTVLETGEAVISVIQTCAGVETATFEQEVAAAAAPAGETGVPAGAPVAVAGGDRTVDEGDTVVLNGRDSFDTDGDDLFYDWSQTSGPMVTLVAPLSPIPIFVAPMVDEMARLEFRLIVDDGTTTDEDEVVVDVMNVLETAGPVTADAGPALAVSEGDVADLSGLGSSGTGIGMLTFTWRQISGPPVTLTSTTEAEVRFTAPEVGPEGATLVFELVVADGEVSDSDTVIVTVFDDDPTLFDPAEVANEPDGDTDTSTSPNDNGDGTPDEVQDGGNGNENDNAADGPATPGPNVFRGVYGGSNSNHLLGPGGPVDMLLADGIEDFGMKLHLMRVPIEPSDVVRLRQWSDELNPHGAKLWVFFNWFSTLEHQWLLPLAEPYVDADGVEEPLKPCPQSQDFWDRAVTARFVALAERTDPANDDYMPELAMALRGVVLDPELYTFTERSYRDPCYCESCVQGLFTLLGINDPVPAPAQRLAYLEGAGLVDDFVAYERGVVESRATACREAFRAVNPNLEIGGTNLVRFDRSPFYIGVPQGFGTPGQPYFDWSQRTFHSGYDDGLQGFFQEISDAGINAFLIPGLLVWNFPPEALADHYYTMGHETGSVWLNRSDHFGGLQLGDLCLPLDEYNQHLTAANAELDLYEADVNHVSPYTGAAFVPACFDPSPYAISTPFEPLEPGPPNAFGPLMRRETGYFFQADAGASLSFDVSMREFGTTDQGSGWWQLVTPSGTIMDNAPLTEALSPSLVRATAVETGIHKLVVNASFVHGFRITGASHPGSYRVVSGTQRLKLFKAHELDSEPQFYAYVPAGVTEVGLLFSSDPAEASDVLLFDERDPTTPLYEALITGTFEPTLNLGTNNNGVVLEFVIRNPLGGGGEDLGLKITSGALPYLSQTRSGLFRSP